MSEQWISNSGELEAIMSGICEEDPELNYEEDDEESCREPLPGETYFDEDGVEWLACADGKDKRTG